MNPNSAHERSAHPSPYAKIRKARFTKDNKPSTQIEVLINQPISTHKHLVSVLSSLAMSERLGEDILTPCRWVSSRQSGYRLVNQLGLVDKYAIATLSDWQESPARRSQQRKQSPELLYLRIIS
ncbi:hypothetical protein D3C81_1620620 [compost metagenome]